MACENPDWVLVGQENGRVRKLDVETNQIDTVFRRAGLGTVTSLAANPAGDRIVAGFESGSIKFGPPDDPPSSEWSDLGDGEGTVSVAIHRDASCIAVARTDTTTDVYSAGRCRHEPTTTIDHDYVLESIDFSPDGYLLAVCQHDGTVQLFSALSGVHVSESPGSVLEASNVFDED